MTRFRLREASVEAAFVRLLRRHALMSLKLNVAGQRGWPDRLVLLPGGEVVFVELKRPGAKARRLQEHIHKRLAALGFRIAVCDDPIKAAAFVMRFGALDKEAA